MIGASLDKTGVTTEVRSIPGSKFEKDAPNLDLYITSPSERSGEALPLLYSIHGGGLVMGSPMMEAARLFEYVRKYNCVVVHPKYRLALDHKYPAAIEDCYSGLVWAAAHAEELGINPDIIVIEGASSGGQLAASLSHLMRDRGDVKISGQILLYPILDDRPMYKCSNMMFDGWNGSSEQLIWKLYLGDLYGRADLPPYAAPARETDYRGLPPTIIHGAELDQDRDELMAYAQNLLDANIYCDLHIWGGVYHGFSFVKDIGISGIANEVMNYGFQAMLTGKMPTRD